MIYQTVLLCVIGGIAFSSASSETALPKFIDYEVDVVHQTLRLHLNDSNSRPYRQFTSLAQALALRGEKVVFAMNAGIFMEDLRPLGLYIEAGKQLRPLNTRKRAFGNFYMQPNGVFLIGDQGYAIVQTPNYPTYAKTHKIQYATQSGPLLVINGHINEALPKGGSKLMRNAVCVKQGRRLILSLAASPVSFREFAHHLSTDKQCSEALYLDGAISDIYWPAQGWTGEYGEIGPMITVVETKRKARKPR